MRVEEIKTVEDCFIGSFTKEVFFDTGLKRDFIEYLGQFGEFKFFSDFSRPYFTVKIADKYTIKGVMGNNSLRLIMETNSQEFVDHFLGLLAQAPGAAD